MTLKFMLWLLALMLKRARNRKARFREQLEQIGGLDWGIATEDLSIARHYRMNHRSIESATGLPVDLDLELRFQDVASAVSVLRRPTPTTFRNALMEGTLRVVGDSRDLDRLQRLFKHLR
ncbi:hypothetical protein [Halomonas huangheensis]|uniref:SCP2 domain-containing protein n=1 Tax=Halomonas huangheensis TaxID=1178482 RepID=W1N5T5_9GAMM|nr:hypothetical protein [Halomonas huangheensis]ALM54375.1 hypothetical protein AR456_20445 [Halomonas huangheensis]ERL50937.1 hypothetical protein BJB45_20290 [Halomonas huangheensis]